MKYLDRYIEEKLKIKVLGELTTNGSDEGDCVGVSLVIDGYEPGIEVWYVDYAKWLEEKIEDLEKRLESEMRLETFLSDSLATDNQIPIKNTDEEIQNNPSEEEVTKVEIENLKINKNRHKMKLEDFRTEVLSALESKPEKWRKGQFVFNYIDATYGVARYVQFVEGIDCFYDDKQIDKFITRSFEEIKNRLK